MRVLITGSRRWSDAETITAVLDFAQQAHPDLAVIVGDCPTGADRIARDWALSAEVPVTQFVAHWGEFGRRAGPIRNQAMIDTYPTVVLAFPLGESRGTRDCMARAETAGIKIINYGDQP